MKLMKKVYFAKVRADFNTIEYDIVAQDFKTAMNEALKAAKQVAENVELLEVRLK